MDFYMDSKNVIDRLVAMYKQHGKIIVAFDFDDTVCPSTPDKEFGMVHQLLKDLKPYATFLVFTASWTERFPYIMKFLDENGLPYDAINTDLVDLGWKSRKPYYNIILDDRGGLKQTYDELVEFIKIIKDIE